MLAIALGLVLDLDRPQRGLIRINLMPLQSAQQMIDVTSGETEGALSCSGATTLLCYT